METRKIQKTGGSSYAISLPKRWIELNSLKNGDVLGIVENKDGTLSIVPENYKKERKSCKIELNENINLTKRILITKYLQGYDTIKIYSKKPIVASKRKEIVSLMQNLIGIEIFEERADEIVFSSLIEFGSTPLGKVKNRIINLTSSMLEDTIKLNEKFDESLAENIIQRDNEVDKLYFFAIREISEASRNLNAAKKLGLNNNFEIIPNLIAIKNIERIADYAVLITKDIMELDAPSAKIKREGNLTLDIFHKTSRSLIRKDYVLANSILEEIERKFSEEINSVIISSILNSMNSIKRHCGNIAETIINLYV
ncbi:phosphate uptake regulator PhoU [bacterium]|nr:phosphate uptake regulator PhoU [Methanomicrobia archaeon]MCD6147897.1 phosphate uptake regulator PhoU [bacterium]